jgi:two-component system, chemotaxis family, response regulator Rcp1
VLVEDNPADVVLVREALGHYQVSHTLTVVPDGEEAIHLIERLEAASQSEDALLPDIVLLDLNLPKRGGFDVLKRMRASARWSRVPVMVLSSSDAQQDKERASSLGVTRYIVKPHLFEEFLKIGQVVKDVLASSQVQ